MQVYVLLAILFVLYMLYKFIFRVQFINNNLSSAGIAKEYTNSMKLIAIIGIVLAHIGVQYHGTNYIGYLQMLIVSLGAFGVQIFFFLSGFGSYFSISKQNKINGYLSWGGRHSFRLIISFIVCYAVVCLIYLSFKQMVFNLYDLLLLLMPYCTTWYLKIQILFYLFLVIAIWIAKSLGKNDDVMACVVFILSLMSIMILQCYGFEDWWWKSNLCFALGILVAINIEKIKSKINGSNRQVILLTILAMFVYILCLKFDKHCLLGPIVATIRIFICFSWFYAIKFKIRFQYYSKYTLELYLIHIGLIELFIKEVDKNMPVVMLIFFTIIATLLANKFVYKLMKIF